MFGLNKKQAIESSVKLNGFNMIQPQKPQVEIPQVDKPKFSFKKERGVFKVKIHGNDEWEQAQYLFREIKFNDKVKFLVYRSLASGLPASYLFIGPKGTAKTAHLEAVLASCYDVLFINSKTTIAGLIEEIRANPNIRIICFDEVDKILDKGEKDDIRGFLQSGRLTRTTKAGGHIEIEIKNMVTLATANSIDKFDGPWLDRFTRIHLPEYTEDQFKEICAFRMPEYNQEIIEGIAQELINQNMKDVRNMVRLRSMLRPTDSAEMAAMILETVIEYEKTSTKNVNWDKK